LYGELGFFALRFPFNGRFEGLGCRESTAIRSGNGSNLAVYFSSVPPLDVKLREV
jgi:hypothetical protein